MAKESKSGSTLNINPKIAEKVLNGSTILKGVYLTLEAQNFEPPTNEPVGKKEVVIGQMDPLEKALYTINQRAGKEIEAMLKKDWEAIKDCDRDCGNCKIVDRARLFQLEEIAKICKKFFWYATRQRLGMDACGFAIGLRANYQMVRMPAGEKPDITHGGCGDQFAGRSDESTWNVMKETILNVDPKIAQQMFANPLLSQVYQSFANNDFIPSVNDPVKEGETVIGQMDALEKALLSVARRAGAEAKKIGNEHPEIFGRCSLDCANCSVKDECEKAQGLACVYKISQALFWRTVVDRLGDEAYGDGIGIRTGYQIVRFPKRETSGDGPGIIMFGPGGIRIL